uniref:small monomeric GTPase n=1 Tax=Oncorhynchus kisutch TaxID=8019 RepID=A0A8C7GHC7_ONCKI
HWPVGLAIREPGPPTPYKLTRHNPIYFTLCVSSTLSRHGKRCTLSTNGCLTKSAHATTTKQWKEVSKKWRLISYYLELKASVNLNDEGAGHISDRQLQWADGFILVYSICDRASFNVVRQQVKRIRQAKSKFPGAPPIVIVGNKRDLQHRRTVSSEEGRLLTLSTNCGFFEISAAETYHGVQLVFHELLDLIREARALKKGAAGIKGIVRSMSAVFGRKRTE